MRQILVWTGVLFAPAMLRGGEMPQAAPVHIGLIVRNLCAAPDEIVRKAEAKCAHVFHAAGIEIKWINSVEDVTWYESPRIVLRAALLPGAPKSRWITALGGALPNKTDGIQLFIYYERVKVLSTRSDLSYSSILSAALMHELGHMLGAKHAAAGVMRDTWGRRELKELGWDRLQFTKYERNRMRLYATSLAEKSGLPATQARQRVTVQH
jgi:hypothetical protein